MAQSNSIDPFTDRPMDEMSSLYQVDTPALVLNRAAVHANAQRMAERFAPTKVKLRPHLKTSKSIDIAHIALAQGAVGGTVSTLKEAEYFYRNALSDLLYAVCITPSKFDRAVKLIAKGCQLTLITDNLDVAQKIADYADHHKICIRMMIEIDSGEHRTGLLPDDHDVTAIGRLFHTASFIEFVGVMTHGGHGYGARGRDDLIAIAEQERSAVVQAAQNLRDIGVSVPVVSLGSTPTVTHAKSFEGIDEARPGVYLLGDLFQASIGACAMSDIAASVLAAVTSHDQANSTLTLDAGALALSKDRSTAKTAIDYGYGLLCDVAGKPFSSALIVADVHQEHGQVRALNGEMPFDRLPVGALVRVLPNHICMTAAMYDRYHLVEAGDPEIVNVWYRTNGW